LKFRGVEYLASSGAPTQKELAAIESAVGARLPAEFRKFLHDANGATIPYAIYVKTDEIDESLNFRFIFDTHEDSEDSFLAQLAAARTRWDIPAAVLPFAREDSGALACLDLRPGRHSAVVALLTDSANLSGRLLDPPFVQVAGSFTEYVDGLVPEFSDAAWGESDDSVSET
jgi:cell wall assembly regulator SMI1